MTSSEIKSAIQDYIARARTQDAIRIFREWASTQNMASLQNDLIALESRWNELRSKVNKGILASNEEGLESNKITMSLLDLLEALDRPQPVVIPKPVPSDTARGILRDDYPKGPQIIEVQMAPAAAPKVAFAKVKKPVKLLFTAAAPRREKQINTGLESRFKDLIKEYDSNRKIKFEQEHGLDKERFRGLLFTEDPHIIHFGGHGSYEGLALEDSDIDADVLTDLIELLDNTQLVVLNACYTLPMAKEIAKYVPYVIGTQGPLDDDAAIAFARSFYTGIAGGKDIEKSFQYGLNGIKAAKAGSQDILVLVKGLREQAPNSTHP